MRILDLWVYVLDDNEGESIAAFTQDGTFFPLLGDSTRCEQLLPYAQQIADSTGKTVRLIQLINRIDRMTITPKETPPDGA